MPNPKQYFLHGVTLALLIALLMLSLVLELGYVIILKYPIERYVEFPAIIVLTIVCIVNVISEMRKYLNG